MYGKHFQSMYQGSMIGRGSAFFAVWGYVISHFIPHREHGAVVELNPKLISMLIGEKEEVVRGVIAQVCEPDPESATKAEEGRKLVRLSEYEYRVVNGAKYRAVRDHEERKIQNRIAQQKYRMRTPNPVAVNPVTPVKDSLTVPPARETLTLEPEPAAPPTKTEKRPNGDPNTHAFIDGWCLNFQAHFDMKYEVSPRDAKAASQIVKRGITILDLLEIAKQSWTLGAGQYSKHCKMAWTIHGFLTAFNEIRVEIKNANQPNHNPSDHPDRSIGTTNEGMSHLYAGLGRVDANGEVRRA